MKNDYAYFKSLGICPQCRRRDAREGKVHCAECAAKRRAYSRLHQDKKNKDNRESARRRKEAGLCRRCAKPAQHGTFCDECGYLRNVRRRIINLRKRRGTWSGKIFDEATLYKISVGVLGKWGVL